MTDFHPVADIFPLMSDREFIDLVDDIREHGCREAIWVHLDGRIIDGRNRYNACRRLGLEPEYRTYEGDDEGLVPFVLSLNLHRRHLNESQRAMVAGRIANLEPHRPAGSAQICAVSQPDAAATLSVSRRAVQHARAVQDRGSPALVAAVDAGQVAVSTAATLTELPAEEQRELVDAADPKALVRRANEIKRERTPPMNGTKVMKPKVQLDHFQKASGQRHAFEHSVNSLSGIAMAMGKIKTIHPDITSEEAARWMGGLMESRGVITHMINQLKERTKCSPKS